MQWMIYYIVWSPNAFRSYTSKHLFNPVPRRCNPMIFFPPSHRNSSSSSSSLISSTFFPRIFQTISYRVRSIIKFLLLLFFSLPTDRAKRRCSGQGWQITETCFHLAILRETWTFWLYTPSSNNSAPKPNPKLSPNCQKRKEKFKQPVGHNLHLAALNWMLVPEHVLASSLAQYTMLPCHACA